MGTSKVIIASLSMALCLGSVLVGCDEAETSTGNGMGEAPSTTVKETERPQSLPADTDDKTILTPPTDTPKALSDTPEKSVDSGAIPVPTAVPPSAVESVSQGVPGVSPLERQGDATSSNASPSLNPTIALEDNSAIAATFQTPDLSATVIPYLVTNKVQIGACQDIRYEEELTLSSSNVYRLDESRYLAHFVCGATAYQILQEYYLYEQTNGVPLVTVLPVPYFYTDLDGQLLEDSERAIAGYSDYDASTQTINIFTKGRGLGDCGSLGFYRLEGSELVVDRFLAKDECDGTYIDPIDYPQVYPET